MKFLIYQAGLALAFLAPLAHGYDLRTPSEPSTRAAPSFSAKSETLTASNFWREKLLSAGVLSDAGKKFRVGVPLVSANAAGPNLMLSIMPRAGEGTRTNRVMCILSKKFD